METALPPRRGNFTAGRHREMRFNARFFPDALSERPRILNWLYARAALNLIQPLFASARDVTDVLPR